MPLCDRIFASSYATCKVRIIAASKAKNSVSRNNAWMHKTLVFRSTHKITTSCKRIHLRLIINYKKALALRHFLHISLGCAFSFNSFSVFCFLGGFQKDKNLLLVTKVILSSKKTFGGSDGFTRKKSRDISTLWFACYNCHIYAIDLLF